MNIIRESEEEDTLLYERQKDGATSVMITTSQNKNNRRNWIPKRNRLLS